MKPYYQDELVTLYNADCLEHADIWLEGGDVMVTDPPYGMAYQSGRIKTRKHKRIAGDETTEARDKVLSLWGDKPAIVFGRWNQPRPDGTIHRLIWSKAPDPGMGNLKMPWGNSDEEIYILGAGWVGKRSANVLTYPTLPANNRPNHPTPKPVPLMEDLIRKCPPGVIIDPFVGSGATLRAAKNLGRVAIGFEVDSDYCEVAAQMLGQEVLFS